MPAVRFGKMEGLSLGATERATQSVDITVATVAYGAHQWAMCEPMPGGEAGLLYPGGDLMHEAWGATWPGISRRSP